jgi:hypothetical protein
MAAQTRAYWDSSFALSRCLPSITPAAAVAKVGVRGGSNHNQSRSKRAGESVRVTAAPIEAQPRCGRHIVQCRPDFESPIRLATVPPPSASLGRQNWRLRQRRSWHLLRRPSITPGVWRAPTCELPKDDGNR